MTYPPHAQNPSFLKLSVSSVCHDDKRSDTMIPRNQPQKDTGLTDTTVPRNHPHKVTGRTDIMVPGSYSERHGDGIMSCMQHL